MNVYGMNHAILLISIIIIIFSITIIYLLIIYIYYYYILPQVLLCPTLGRAGVGAVSGCT